FLFCGQKGGQTQKGRLFIAKKGNAAEVDSVLERQSLLCHSRLGQNQREAKAIALKERRTLKRPRMAQT
ncbi:MAG: hypothetical protein KDJ97_33060, partial [Anaerolineae bacterium]|nr:hypothetical protein [Anaerolineae bacterium]